MHLYFISYLFLLCGSGWFHPIHVSVTNMEIVSDEDIFVSVKVYLDDFETVLKMSENVNIDFKDSVDVVEKHEHIMSYFSKKINVLSKKKALNKFSFLEWKPNDEAGWFNFTIDNSVGFVPDSISNEILMDLYPDQTNLLIVYYMEKEYGYRFNDKNRILTTNFKK